MMYDYIISAYMLHICHMQVTTKHRICHSPMYVCLPVAMCMIYMHLLIFIALLLFVTTTFCFFVIILYYIMIFKNIILLILIHTSLIYFILLSFVHYLINITIKYYNNNSHHGICSRLNELSERWALYRLQTHSSSANI